MPAGAAEAGTGERARGVGGVSAAANDGNGIRMEMVLHCAFSHSLSTHLMKFVHLVEINDPLNPLIEPLTREQLWRGLVLRAEAPKRFVDWLDGSEIRSEGIDGLARTLHYGEVTIRDTVSFTPQQQVQYDVPAQGDIPASRLLVTIEEPGTDRLNVRFSYDDFMEETPGSMEAFYNEFRRSAYQEADIDTVRIIRELASEGLLDGAQD